MPIEFDVKLTVKDMYRFSMYHTYTGFQGILSIIVAVVAFVFAITTVNQVSIGYTFVYFGFGVLFLFYMPVAIYMNAKRQILTSDVLKNALHYTVDEDGITTSQGEQTAQLTWAQVYKVKETVHNILVYSNRRNAFVIPKESLGADQESMLELVKTHLEKFRLSLKK